MAHRAHELAAAEARVALAAVSMRRSTSAIESVFGSGPALPRRGDPGGRAECEGSFRLEKFIELADAESRRAREAGARPAVAVACR